MQTTELESHVYAEYDDQFIWFVLLAFICMAIDIVLVDRANPMFSKIKLFE
jgi:Ca-activated chloride channel family protein